MTSNNRITTITSHLTQKTGRSIVRESVTPLEHKGYGKVILFGEHFVVYGVPAVVCAVNEFTDCQIKRLPKGKSGWTVTDNRPAVPGYITSKAAEQKMAHDLVVKHLNLDLTNGIEIVLGGSLVPTSGIGASASNVAALARALSHSFDLNLSTEEVNQAAYVGEGGYHGTPSGIDNTAATYGGLLSFKRTPTGPKFDKLTTPAEGHLVVVSTGITASTTTVVGEVRKIRETCPLMFAHLQQQYTSIYERATAALSDGDWATVGALMTENHTLLRDLGLSIPEIEQIVSTAMKAGAIGAKLSGTGRGGIAIALCPDAHTQSRVAAELKSLPAARFIWKYSIGGK